MDQGVFGTFSESSTQTSGSAPVVVVVEPILQVTDNRRTRAKSLK